MPPSPAATPAGAPPSGMVAVTAPLPGSILDTVASVTLAAQTDPYPYASPTGPLPTAIVATTVPVRGLTSCTVLSNSFATQISPAPATTPAGPRPTRMRSTTRPAESTRSRKLSALSVTQTAPAPGAIPFGRPTPVTTTLRPPRPASITATESGRAARWADPRVAALT